MIPTSTKKQKIDNNDGLSVYNSEIKPIFTEFATELDKINDKRERVIKVCRDITILSKRTIFLLHRITQTDRNVVLTESETKLNELKVLFLRVSNELQGNSYHRFHNNIAGGFEEFIECFLFYKYIATGKLISKAEVDEFFIDKNGNSALRVSEQDYILGIADFTGELMRYCINMVGRHRNEEVNHSKALLQQISAVFGELDFTFLKRKTEELKRSLAKVEKVCYMVKVQQAEFPDINLNIDISNVKFEDDFPKNG